MVEQWNELKETIIELRDNDGKGSQQEVCEFLANLMDVLEKQMEPERTKYIQDTKAVQSDRDCVDLSEKVTATFYDDEYEEWSQRTVTIRDVLDSVCDSYTVIEPKRKTGKWVKHPGDWFTPGGDMVWECSECGKGVHVYGVEYGTYGADVSDGQWKACPNCTALMEG